MNRTVKSTLIDMQYQKEITRCLFKRVPEANNETTLLSTTETELVRARNPTR